MTISLWEAVNKFFGRMVKKLIHQHETHGYTGWDFYYSIKTEVLVAKLYRNIEEQDWVDVANLAMILDYRKGAKE
jgi:hypothetical protein